MPTNTARKAILMLKKIGIGVAIIVLLAIGGIAYVSQPAPFNQRNKLVASTRLNDNTWSYVLVSDGGSLATVNIVYRMYLTAKIDDPDVLSALEKERPILASDDEHASVKWDGSKFVITTTGVVFRYTNHVVLPDINARIVFSSDSKE